MTERFERLNEAVELVIDELGDPEILDIRLGKPEADAIRKLRDAYEAVHKASVEGGDQ